MISWLTKRWKASRARKKHDKITAEYRQVACNIGDAISYMGMGDVWITLRGEDYSMRDAQVYHVLDELEEAYAGLGYRIVPLDNWIDYAGWGVKMDHLWLVKREEDERPVFTKLEPKRELPQESKLLQTVMETGKACEAVRNEDGEMEIRVLEDE